MTTKPMEFDKDVSETGPVEPESFVEQIMTMLTSVAERAHDVEGIVILTRTRSNDRLNTGGVGDLDSLFTLLDRSAHDFKLIVEDKRIAEALDHISQCRECSADPENMERVELMKLRRQEIALEQQRRKQLYEVAPVAEFQKIISEALGGTRH